MHSSPAWLTKCSSGVEIMTSKTRSHERYRQNLRRTQGLSITPSSTRRPEGQRTLDSKSVTSVMLMNISHASEAASQRLPCTQVGPDNTVADVLFECELFRCGDRDMNATSLSLSTYSQMSFFLSTKTWYTWDLVSILSSEHGFFFTNSM